MEEEKLPDFEKGPPRNRATKIWGAMKSGGGALKRRIKTGTKIFPASIGARKESKYWRSMVKRGSSTTSKKQRRRKGAAPSAKTVERIIQIHNDSDLSRNLTMVSASNKWRIGWDICICLLLVYVFIVLPLEITYSQPSSKFWQDASVFVDVFFWVSTAIGV